MDNGKIKIAIVARSLAGGGAERFSALLATMLFDLGFEVKVVTVLDEIEYEYKGELFNLGKYKNADDSILGRIKRLFLFRKFLKAQNFDWVIDSRIRSASWSEYIISKFIYTPKKTLYVVHSYKLENYFPKNRLVASLIYKDAAKVITVSKEIENRIQSELGYKNTETIYNAIDPNLILKSKESNVISDRYILAYGRIIDSIKNYSLLIESYANSTLPEQNISLLILGDGIDVSMLQRRVAELELTDKVIFKPKEVNPFPFVKQAIFTILTSRNEGFPMVLIESLALGTPVISVDCQSGPREIIQNEHNGLLVENHNPGALSNAMNRMLFDTDLYAICKKNAAMSVRYLAVENIGKEWEAILMGKK